MQETAKPAPHVIYMNAPGTESLTFHATARPDITWSGWAAYHSVDPTLAEVTVRLRFGLRTDKAAGIEIRELWTSVQANADLGGHVVRALPWARLEAAVNQPSQVDLLTRQLLPAFAHTTKPPEPTDDLWLRRPEPVRQHRPRLRLRIPTDFRKPDEFYADVADRFMQLVVLGEGSPAEALADANPGVNVSTVHRWIKEARLRGVLPAAPRAEKRGSR